MTSQLAQYGDMGLVNDIAGQAYPLVNTATPGAPVTPNQLWVNANPASVVSRWNGASWVTVTTNAALPLWIALLTTDPVAGAAVNLTDIGFNEVTTSGYARQSITFTTATAQYPSSASNTGVLTFGPLNTNMLVPTQWAALVTVASGTAGFLLATWQLVAPIQAQISQSIQCGIGQLILQGQ